MLFIVRSVAALAVVLLISLLLAALMLEVVFDRLLDWPAVEIGALCQETSKRPSDGTSDDCAMNYRSRVFALVSYRDCIVLP